HNRCQRPQARVLLHPATLFPHQLNPRRHLPRPNTRNGPPLPAPPLLPPHPVRIPRHPHPPRLGLPASSALATTLRPAHLPNAESELGPLTEEQRRCERRRQRAPAVPGSRPRHRQGPARAPHLGRAADVHRGTPAVEPRRRRFRRRLRLRQRGAARHGRHGQRHGQAQGVERPAQQVAGPRQWRRHGASRTARPRPRGAGGTGQGRAATAL
ncbi:hypothetical protein LTR60_004731, partial [Cryomyces antarcticus]